MKREIKFRVWIDCIEPGKMIYPQHLCFHADGTISSEEHLGGVPLQFIGLKDANGVEVYEGDVVKFKYFVGDFAWEDMTPKERKSQEQRIGKEYVGEVKWYEPLKNFAVVCGEESSTHAIFPILYAGGKNAKVMGHIYGNTKNEE